MNSKIVLTLVILAFAVDSHATEPPDPTDPNRYLDAVRTFADNVLKYGRDTYGPKHTPLFVDGLNIHTHEPVKWISPKGGNPLTATETEEWIISNFASQQTLLRTLDGLTSLMGDPKYRDAAMEATKYAFENLRAPNGLFYWGQIAAYDAQADKVRTASRYAQHCLKPNYPYYELLWRVDPEATNRFIEAFWCAHVLDWSNLDFCRISVPYSENLQLSWDHEYQGGPVFFKSKRSWGAGFLSTATSLVYSGTTLTRFSGQEEPLVWSTRLMRRFVNTRHPNTGITAHLYNQTNRTFPNEKFEKNFTDPYTTVFPQQPFEWGRSLGLRLYAENWQPLMWLSLLLVGDSLGEQGKEFTQWGIEELTAWANSSYREEDNSFVPILTDGTNIEGVVLEKQCGIGFKGDRAIPLFAGPEYFWLYCTAYKIADGDALMWQMARKIAIGNDFGDIGATSSRDLKLNIDTTCSDVYALLGFLELYDKTNKQEFLSIARRIADNIVQEKFHKGFFVTSNQNLYSRFDCFEPLALLRLVETLSDRTYSLPRIWPTVAMFVANYRYRVGNTSDRWAIYYKLTGTPECSEVSWSLGELAHTGDIDKVKMLLDSGINVDDWREGWNNGGAMTGLQRAAISGHKDIAELLMAHAAQVDYVNLNTTTPLCFAVQYGHKDIVQLLLDHGADINVKNTEGRTPIDLAREAKHSEIVELLRKHGAKE